MADESELSELSEEVDEVEQIEEVAQVNQVAQSEITASLLEQRDVGDEDYESLRPPKR